MFLLPIPFVRYYGIQTILLWISCTEASILLLVKSYSTSKRSTVELAFTFVVVGALASAAVLGAWKEVEISPNFYTYSPSSPATYFVLGICGVYLFYIAVMCVYLFVKSKEYAFSRSQKSQLLLLSISMAVLIPGAAVFHFFASTSFINNPINSSSAAYVSSLFIALAFTLIFLTIGFLGKYSLPKFAKIYQLLIINKAGIPVYQYKLLEHRKVLDYTLFSAALTSISIFFKELIQIKSSIREISFDDFYFLCSFKPFRANQNIPAYSCVLVSQKKSLFVRTAFKRFVNQFDNKFRESIRDLKGNKINSEGIDSLVKKIFMA